jgi:hypothetical protein
MNCRQFRGAVYLNRDGELSRDEARAIAEHLAGCERCASEKARADGLALFRKNIAAIGLAPEDPQYLTRRILERVSNKSRRESEKERVFTLDRFLSVVTTPMFRLTSSGAIALIAISFLIHAYGILREVHDLEIRQQYPVEVINVPHLDFAVDVRPLRGTPEGAMLNRIEGHAIGTHLVVNERHSNMLRSRERALSWRFPGPQLPSADRETIRALVSYFKENGHPVISFTREGV